MVDKKVYEKVTFHTYETKFSFITLKIGLHKMKKINWIAVGKRGNAGDALLYEVTKELFQRHFEINFICAQKPSFANLNSDKIVIGPGAVLSGTFTSKILLKFLEKKINTLDKYVFYLFSMGVTNPIEDNECNILQSIFNRTKLHLVRGKYEKKLFSAIGHNKTFFCPCPSLFASEIFEVKSRKRDVVVLNLDSFLFTKENIKAHPMIKFKEYAKSLGLEVRLMINGRPDINKFMLDIFEPLSYDTHFFIMR